MKPPNFDGSMAINGTSQQPPSAPSSTTTTTTTTTSTSTTPSPSRLPSGPVPRGAPSPPRGAVFNLDSVQRRIDSCLREAGLRQPYRQRICQSWSELLSEESSDGEEEEEVAALRALAIARNPTKANNGLLSNGFQHRAHPPPPQSNSSSTVGTVSRRPYGSGKPPFRWTHNSISLDDDDGVDSDDSMEEFTSLPLLDIDLYGFHPSFDALITTRCICCSRIIQIGAFLQHMEKCHTYLLARILEAQDANLENFPHLLECLNAYVANQPSNGHARASTSNGLRPLGYHAHPDEKRLISVQSSERIKDLFDFTEEEDSESNSLMAKLDFALSSEDEEVMEEDEDEEGAVLPFTGHVPFVDLALDDNAFDALTLQEEDAIQEVEGDSTGVLTESSDSTGIQTEPGEGAGGRLTVAEVTGGGVTSSGVRVRRRRRFSIRERGGSSLIARSGNAASSSTSPSFAWNHTYGAGGGGKGPLLTPAMNPEPVNSCEAGAVGGEEEAIGGVKSATPMIIRSSRPPKDTVPKLTISWNRLQNGPSPSARATVSPNSHCSSTSNSPLSSDSSKNSQASSQSSSGSLLGGLQAQQSEVSHQLETPQTSSTASKPVQQQQQPTTFANFTIIKGNYGGNILSSANQVKPAPVQPKKAADQTGQQANGGNTAPLLQERGGRSKVIQVNAPNKSTLPLASKSTNALVTAGTNSGQATGAPTKVMFKWVNESHLSPSGTLSTAEAKPLVAKKTLPTVTKVTLPSVTAVKRASPANASILGGKSLMLPSTMSLTGGKTTTMTVIPGHSGKPLSMTTVSGMSTAAVIKSANGIPTGHFLIINPRPSVTSGGHPSNTTSLAITLPAGATSRMLPNCTVNPSMIQPPPYQHRVNTQAPSNNTPNTTSFLPPLSAQIPIQTPLSSITPTLFTGATSYQDSPMPDQFEPDDEEEDPQVAVSAQKESEKLTDPSLTDYLDLEEILLSDLLSEDAAKKKAALNLQSTEMDSFLENILVQPKAPTPTTPKRESATPTLSAMLTEPSRVLNAQPDRVFSPKLAPGTFKTQPEIKLESEVEVKLESAHAPAEVKLESHPSTEIKLESGTFAEGDTPTEEELLQAMCELSTVSADDSAPNGTPGKKRPPRNRSKSTASDKKKIILCKNRTYTPDEHCGVQMAGMDRPCTRSLTCRSHMIALRRAVEGRSKPFDELLAEYRKERGMVDTRDRKRASRAKGKGTGEADSTAEQAEEEEEEGDYSQLDDLLSMDVSGESAKREVRRQSDLKMEYSDDDCSEVSLLSEASSSVAKAVSGTPTSSSFAHPQVKVESTQVAELPKGNLLPAPVFASIHQPKKLSQGKTAPGGAPGSTSLTATSISLSALLDKPIYSPKSSSPGVVASLPSATLLSSIKASSPLVRRPSSSKFHTATSSSKPLLPITAASSAEIEVPDEALSRICLGPRSRQQVTLASLHSKATFSRSESSGDDELSSEEEELDEPSSEAESSSWPTPSNIIKSESPLYESSDSLFSEKSLFEEFQLNPDCFSAEAKSLTANRRRTLQLNVGFTRLGALALACRLKRRAAERVKGDGALSQASWIRISREVARKRARLRSKITKKRKRIKLTRRKRNQLASPLGPPRLSGAHEPPQTPMTPATPVTPAFPGTPPVSASKTFLFSDSQPFGSLKVTPGKAITTSLAFPATAAQPGTRTLGTGGVTSRAGSTFWTGSLNNLPTTSSGAFTMLNPTFNSPPGSTGGMTTTAAQLASPVKSSSPLQPTALMSLLNSKPVLRHAGSSSSSKSPLSREKHPTVSRNAVITVRKFPISVNIRSSTLEQLKNGPNFSQASVAAVSGPNDGQQSPFQKNRFDETSRIIENIKSELISSYEMKRRRSSFSQSASASASIPADGSNIRLIADGLTSSGVTLPRTVTRQHSLGSQSSRFSSTFSPVHDITVPSMEISKPSGNEVPEDIFNLIVDLEEGNCGEVTKRAVDGVTGKTLVTSVVSNEMATTALNPTPSPMDSDMEYLLSSSFQPNTSSAMVSVQQFGGTLSFVDSVKVTPPRAQEQPEQLQQPQQLQQMQQLRVQGQQVQPLQGNSQQAPALKLQMQPASNQQQQQVKVQQQQLQSQVVLQGQPSQAQQSVQPTVQQAQPSPSPITVTKVPGQLQPAQLAKLHQIRLQNKLKYEQQQAQLNRLIAQHQAQAQSGAPQTAQQLAQLTKLQQIRAQNKLKFEQQQTQLQRILLQHAQSTQLQQAQNQQQQQQQQQQQAQVNQQGQQQQQQQQVQVQFTSSPQQVQLPNQPQTMQITIQQPNQLRTNQFIQLQAGSGQQGQQVHVLQSGPQTNQASLQLKGQAAGSLLTAGQRTTGPIKISFAPQGANLRPKPKGPLAVATKSVASAPLSEKILVQCPSSLLPKQANEAVEVVNQQQQQQQQSIQQQQQQQQSQQAAVGPVNSAPKVAIFNGSLDNLRNTNTLKSLNNAISSAGLKLQRSHRTYAQGTTKQVTGQLVSSTSVMSGGSGASEKTKFIIPITVSGTISGSTVTSNPKTGEVRMSPQGGQIHLQASSSNAGGTVTTTPTSAKLGGSSAFLPITLSSLSAGNQQAIILPITSLPHNGQNIYILHQGGGDHGQASVSGASNASSSSTPSNQTIQMATVQSTSGGGGGSGGSLAMSTVQQSIQQQQQQQTGATVPTGGTAAGSTPVQLQLSQGGQQFQLQFLSSPNSNPKQ